MGYEAVKGCDGDQDGSKLHLSCSCVWLGGLATLCLAAIESHIAFSFFFLKKVVEFIYKKKHLNFEERDEIVDAGSFGRGIGVETGEEGQDMLWRQQAILALPHDRIRVLVAGAGQPELDQLQDLSKCLVMGGGGEAGDVGVEGLELVGGDSGAVRVG